jgi:hypothetical protein
MNEKISNGTNKKKEADDKTDIIGLIEKKISFFNDIIQKTILNVQKNKVMDILGVSDVNACINTLTGLHEKMMNILSNNEVKTTELLINELQNINNELSGLLKIYGTESLDDLLTICFGTNKASNVCNNKTSACGILLNAFSNNSFI